MNSRVAVLGAGQFGFALACRLAQGGIKTVLWGRSPHILSGPRAVSQRFSGGSPPLGLQVTGGSGLPSLDDFDLVFVATDSSGLAELVPMIAQSDIGDTPVLLVQKGLVNGVSPVEFASAAGLNAGSFTGAAFASDIYLGSEAMMIVAAEDVTLCITVMELLKPLKFWITACSDPDAICAANVARTITSIEMGIVSGFADYLQRQSKYALVPHRSPDFTPTEIAAATASIQYEWRVVSAMLSPVINSLLYPEVVSDDVSIVRNINRERILRVLSADNYLCSGMILDRNDRGGDSRVTLGLPLATPVSRNWRFGYALGCWRYVPDAIRAVADLGVIQGQQNALDLYKRFGASAPPFLTSLGRILTEVSKVEEEIQVIRDRRDAWYEKYASS